MLARRGVFFLCVVLLFLVSLGSAAETDLEDDAENHIMTEDEAESLKSNPNTDAIAERFNAVLGFGAGGVVDIGLGSQDGPDAASVEQVLDVFGSLDTTMQGDVLNGLGDAQQTIFLEEWADSIDLSVAGLDSELDLSWESSADGLLLRIGGDGGPTINMDHVQTVMNNDGVASPATPYNFDGSTIGYTGTPLVLESLDVSGEGVSYKFQGNVEVNLQGDGYTFDLAARQFTSIENADASFTWVNNKGSITVDSDGKIHLSMSGSAIDLDSTDTTNFPILIDDNGLHISPYQVEEGTTAQSPFNAQSLPDVGKYKAFLNEDGIFLVDSEGTVRQSREAVISPDGAQLTNTFVNDNSEDGRQYGRVFTSKDMQVQLGDNAVGGGASIDENTNHIKVTEGSDALAVSIRSEDGRAFYEQQAAVGDLDVKGTSEVDILNGNAVTRVSGETVNLRKLDGESTSDFEYDVREFSVDGVSETYSVREGVLYEGEQRLVFKEGSIRALEEYVPPAQPEPEQQPGTQPGTTPPGQQPEVQPYVTEQSDPDVYRAGFFQGRQYIRYNSVDYVRGLLNEQGSVQVVVTEPSHCPHCRNNPQDPNKIYLTNEQVIQLGGRSGSIPRTITLRR